MILLIGKWNGYLTTGSKSSKTNVRQQLGCNNAFMIQLKQNIEKKNENLQISQKKVMKSIATNIIGEKLHIVCPNKKLSFIFLYMYIYVRQIRDKYVKEEISKSNMN